MSWLIYLIIVLSNIKLVASVSVFVLLTALLMLGCLSPMIFDVIDDGDYKMFKKYTKLGIIVFIISVVLSVFIPSLKESAAIILIPKIVENEQVQGISDKGLNLLNSKLNEWLEESIKEEK